VDGSDRRIDEARRKGGRNARTTHGKRDGDNHPKPQDRKNGSDGQSGEKGKTEATRKPKRTEVSGERRSGSGDERRQTNATGRSTDTNQPTNEAMQK